jgi:hypothetical protein
MICKITMQGNVQNPSARAAEHVAHALGVLMLDTRFPRVEGDIGNPSTFAFPVRYRTIRGASPERVVRERDPALLEPFIDAGRALVAEGVSAITTSCGFLVLFQQQLETALPVPVWTSSLLALKELEAAGEVCGVVTVDAPSLSAQHLAAAGASPHTPVAGLAPGCAFQRTLLGNERDLDVAVARADTVEASMRLIERHPEVTSILLECTNMPPYADAVRAATGRKVHDITTLLRSRFDAGPAPNAV